MNLDDFCDKLALTKNKYTWYLDGSNTATTRSNLLRASCDEYAQWMCPITAVHSFEGYGFVSSSDYYRAGVRLGLPGKLISRIMRAADGTNGDIRRRMIEALGLTKTEAKP